MNYPKEVQECLDVLKKYNLNENLTTYDIFHLYPKELAYPNGYYDSRFFELFGYNTKTMEYRKIRVADELDFYSCKDKDISMMRIFADGSTLIKFNETHEVIAFCQSVSIR